MKEMVIKSSLKTSLLSLNQPQVHVVLKFSIALLTLCNANYPVTWTINVYLIGQSNQVKDKCVSLCMCVSFHRRIIFDIDVFPLGRKLSS